MDKATKAPLHDVYLCLTIAQRATLKAIEEFRNSGQIDPICESLVDAGLVRRSGDRFVATDGGCYVVTLF